MTPQLIGTLGVLALAALTLLRVPLGAALGLVGLFGDAALDEGIAPCGRTALLYSIKALQDPAPTRQRRGSDPDFEARLKKFMRQSEERQVDFKRSVENKRK